MNFDKKNIFRAFFFIAFAILIYNLLKLLSPFFSALMAAITLSLIFYPVHAFLRRRLSRWDNLSAGLSTALILLIIIVPLTLFLWILFQQAEAMTPFIGEKTRAWRAAPSLTGLLPAPLVRLLEKTQVFMAAWQIDVQDIFLKNVEQMGKTLSSMGGKIVKNTAFLLFDFFVMGFSLFFLFRDGERIVHWVMELVPMETAHKDHLLQRLNQTLSAVVRGVFLTAAVQGLLAGLGYAACGVRFSVFLGFTTAFLAPIPFVGATAVWLPVGLTLVFTGAKVQGILLLIWGALVVSTTDNFLRPILIGEKAKLPTFLLFFGMLGGIQVHGPVGILTGPLLIAMAMAFAKIYHEQMASPIKTVGIPPLKSLFPK